MIKLGSTNIGKLYLGSTPIGKAYLGSTLVYQVGAAGFAVAYALTNVTSSNGATSVAAGDPYTTTLTPATYHAITSVTVLMGGVDITATAYSNGVVTIASVIGPISITAVAVHQYNDWIRMRIKKGDASATVGWVVRTATIMNNSVSKMMVDGVEVTKNFKYDFGDSDLHTVFLKLNSSTDLPESIFYCQAGCIKYLWVPPTYLVLGASAIRQLGQTAAKAADVLWTNPNIPTSVGSNNQTANTYVKIYVPDDSLTAYQNHPSGSWPKSRCFAMSTYTGTIY